LLDDLIRSSFNVVRGLSDERVVKALQLSVINERKRHELLKFLNRRSATIKGLGQLASLIPSVKDALQLSGKYGQSGPFHKVQVSPKVLLSIYGRKIFTELAITKRPPSARHAMFVDFLDCVWILSANSSETDNDWSTPIKIAALQRETGSGAGAHLLARLAAGDFTGGLLRDLGIAEGGLH
jgi:hypothetical protein